MVQACEYKDILRLVQHDEEEVKSRNSTSGDSGIECELRGERLAHKQFPKFNTVCDQIKSGRTFNACFGDMSQ